MTKPIDDNQKHIIDEAVQLFVDAQLLGQEPNIDEFVKQYPDLEQQIRQKIQNLLKIDTLFDSLVQADESEFESTIVAEDLSGRKVGFFEIIEVIGRGGMGIVYLAHDTKLDRSVAVKSMPPELRDEVAVRTRFQREAKLLASLNHPNIAVIYDIIEQDGVGYLILEYVPGETLAARIASEPLKLEEALSIGQQIAEAVSAAHKEDVVHRDLKPGNIKITPDGRIKVLDFGLAKAFVVEGNSQETNVTQHGRIIGTPTYMSPEQARGKSIDHRTDIWSFGCIMYEMLTGHVPFEGQTATDTLVQIIERQPDWEILSESTPMNIRVLIRRCLEKDSRQRLQHIADAVLEIRETLSLPMAVPPVTTPSSDSFEAKRAPKKQSIKTLIIIAAIIVVVLSIVTVLFTSRKHAQSSPKQILLVVLPFENLGSTEDEYFADGVTDSITARLAGLHGLSVISRQSAMQYKNRERNTRQIAEELGIDYILEGTVQRERPTEPTSRSG
jgi:serine/threonine protein kinase